MSIDNIKEALPEYAKDLTLNLGAIMGMNNVFYRTKGQLDGRYDDLRAGLRDANVERATIFEAIRLASIVSGVAQALSTVDALAAV